MWMSTAVFMMSFKMKTLNILAGVASAVCCLSCVESNYKVGGDLVPVGQTYTFYTVEAPLTDVYVRMADSLSGFSSSRITIGAVRDSEYGLTTRGSVVSLIPLVDGEMDFGTNPEFKSFHFSAAKDTVSVASADQASILQTIKVYELSRAVETTKDYDCNTPFPHGSKTITRGTPVFNGEDSLSFYFSDEFGKKYMDITADDLKDINTYLKKFPGIYIETAEPQGEGGRIDMFDLQLDYDSDYGYIEGNYAKLSFSAEYNGERKDSSFLFYYGADKFYDLDSLFSSTSSGEYPQYALNLTSQETGDRVGYATDKISIEGGGGLKPVISAAQLKKIAEEAIASKGGDPKKAVINKASLVFPFEAPARIEDLDEWPDVLSPTCRIKQDEITRFMGLTDSGSSYEDQGDINRSILEYSPDITFHLQELIKIDPDDASDTKIEKLNKGYYDIWLLIMADEVITTTTSGSSDLSEMYQYLAYQSYYNDMYGGYGSYGGYSNYYSNYYNYAMMAAYASQSTTTSSISTQLDKDRFYKATLNGPSAANGRVPRFEITFAIPNE